MAKRNYVRVFLAAAVLLVAVAGASIAAEHMGDMKMGGHKMMAMRPAKTMTIKGELVDLTCYLSEGAKGPGHKMCATMCVQKGLPMGVLTSSGKTYLLIEDHDKTGPYAAAKKMAADKVTVTGPVFDKGGLTGIRVEKITKG